MSSAQYKLIGSPPLEPLPPGARLRSATGTSMEAWGLTSCLVRIGRKVYAQSFIVCNKMMTNVIVGRDFLSTYKLSITWGDEGTMEVMEGQEPVIRTGEVHQYPAYVGGWAKVPPRTVAAIPAIANLPPFGRKTLFRFDPLKENLDLQMNSVVYPLDYATWRGGHQHTVQLIINLAKEPLLLAEGTLLGYYEREDEGEMIVDREGLFEVNIEKSWEAGELEDKLFPPGGDGFITSPAEVDPRPPIKLRDAEVSREHRVAFERLCEEFADVFSQNSGDLGKTPLMRMEIPTGDNPPISQRPYGLALRHVQWVQDEIETLERAGVITKSVSPWASPIVIVPKKTSPGEPPRRRMCVDYRMLNSLLPKVEKAHTKAKGVLTLVPIPKIDEIYAKLEGSTVYSTFDMRSGYYHLELTTESQPKSAFVVGGPKGGKWEFKRCPFGLTQAPAYFQALVNQVLEGLNFAFGYLDDILIFSPDMDQHLEHVRTLFERLRAADLKLTKRKCSFLKAHVQYLGHYVSGQGLEPVPEKLEALVKMPPPEDVTGVRKFLGFVGYYRKFIPRYSDVARPLTNLTRKDTPFQWTTLCQEAFEMLKSFLLKEPVLKYPNPDQPYVLYTDASKYAWAGVLTQAHTHMVDGVEKEIHHPVTYVSGLFRGPQINWAALVKEAYAIYMAARKLHYYISNSDTTIRSDHMPLRRFLLKNTKNTTVNNWAVSIEDYQLKFEYIKGVKNTLADTMSRLVQLDPDVALPPEPEGQQFGKLLQGGGETSTDIDYLIEQVVGSPKTEPKGGPMEGVRLPSWGLKDAYLKDAQGRDALCQRIFAQAAKNGEKAVHPYFVEQGILMKYVSDYKQRFEVVVVPPHLAPMLLKLAHDDLGHNGTARTYMILRRSYYWKGMKSFIATYVKRCDLCRQHNATATRYVKGTFEIPKAPMDFISMDLIGEFYPPSSQGNRYALTVICMLTGWVWCVPIPDKTANAVLKAYLKEVHHVFGPSKKVLSDNGTEFKNDLFDRVAKELGVEHKVYSPPYHPQSNGRIEGFHLFLKACMAKHISPGLEWDEVCPIATAAYNFLPNEHARESPFFLMFGRDPRIPLTEVLKPRLRYLGNEDVILSLEALKNMYLIVTENLRRARGTGQHKGPSKNIITPNQLVTLKVHLRKTLAPRYEGNYRIVSVKGNQVELAREGTVLPTKWYHVSHVKPLLQANEAINRLPAYDTFGRKGKLAIHPDNIPDARVAKP